MIKGVHIFSEEKSILFFSVLMSLTVGNEVVEWVELLLPFPAAPPIVDGTIAYPCQHKNSYFFRENMFSSHLVNMLTSLRPFAIALCILGGGQSPTLRNTTTEGRSPVQRLGPGLSVSMVQNLTGGPVQYWLDVRCWKKSFKCTRINLHFQR